MVKPAPRSYINDMEGLQIAFTHGSPWKYDTHVPVILQATNAEAQKVSRAITPYDIAPTLSNTNKLGITQPSGSIGQVLQEITE